MEHVEKLERVIEEKEGNRKVSRLLNRQNLKEHAQRLLAVEEGFDAYERALIAIFAYTDLTASGLSLLKIENIKQEPDRIIVIIQREWLLAKIEHKTITEPSAIKGTLFVKTVRGDCRPIHLPKTVWPIRYELSKLLARLPHSDGATQISEISI